MSSGTMPETEGLHRALTSGGDLVRLECPGRACPASAERLPGHRGPAAFPGSVTGGPTGTGGTHRQHLARSAYRELAKECERARSFDRQWRILAQSARASLCRQRPQLRKTKRKDLKS